MSLATPRVGLDRGLTLALTLALGPALACGDDTVSTAGSVTDSDGSSSGSTGSTSGTSGTTSAGTATSGASATGSSTGDTSTATGSTGDTTGTSSTTSVETTGDTSTTTGVDPTTTGDTTTTTTTGDTTTTGGDTTTTTGGDTTTTGGDLFDGGYVGMSTTDSLVAFDLMTKAPVADIDLLPEGDYPYDVVLRPGGEEVWVVGAVGDGVKVISTATQTVTKSIDLSGVGDYAVDVLFSADASLAYVASRDSKAVVIIDAATYTVVDSIPMPGGAQAGKMTLDPCTDLIYAVEWYGDQLFQIDPQAKSVKAAAVGKSLWDLRSSADGKTLYVLDRGTDELRVVDAGTLTQTDSVLVGDDPWGIELTVNGATAVVVCEDDASVHIIDTSDLSKLVKALPNGAKPRDVDIDGSDNTAYIPSGDVLGDDGIFTLVFDADEAVFHSMGKNYNSNAIAVRPQLVACKP
ncbi:MAG: YncE family protein [Myxococcales bacterium]|nr:YncE family protein [Myxococcales bacterium]